MRGNIGHGNINRSKPPSPTPVFGSHYKTIAVIAKASGDTKVLAHFGEEIVRVGAAQFDLKDDFDHPNVIYISHENLDIARKMAFVFGADIIAEINDGKISLTNSGVGDKMIRYTSPSTDLTEVAKNAIDRAVNWQRLDPQNRPRLKNVNPSKDCGTTLPKEITDNLEFNNKLREGLKKRIGNAITGDVDLFVLGGAGPGASADFVTKFVDQDEGNHTGFIHHSLNQCPGKYPYVSGKGASFKPFYENSVSFANMVGAKFIVTPCNTNHIIMKHDLDGSTGWTEPFKDKVIDFRETLTKHLQEKVVKKVLILGTKATTQGIEHKFLPLYDESLKNAGIEALKANEDGEDKIMDAIYLVKNGRMEEARILIDQVIDSKRSEPGKEDLAVVLACTELPLVYTEDEIRERGLICVSSTAIDFFLERNREIKAETSPGKVPSPKGHDGLRKRSREL